AVDRTEEFFRSVGVPTRLSEHGVDAAEAAEAVSRRLAKRGVCPGEFGDLGEKEIREIIELAK
ncbi:MAG: NADH-dependent alcohol dehydrogenase, partial [Patescibacteria group bacterium]|nr:NADH-dependent alcohol dehydrogenase [Patescibacteria group bacterium]